MIRRRLTGLLACLVIVAILVGLPIVLLTVGGNPIPDRWPTIGRIADWLTRPDDGSLALEAICLAGWIVWLLLGATIISEIIASVRGITIPIAPPFKVPQLAVRQLVAAAALLFLSTQALSSVPMAHGDDTSTPPTPAAALAAGRPADVSLSVQRM